jgi:hypothetical protein
MANKNSGSALNEKQKVDSLKQVKENAKHEMVKFYLWLVNLRIDQLISNLINLFQTKLEKLLSKNETTLD